MTERKKVIKGLEYCNGEGLCIGEKCPYYDDEMCVETLHSDALALLKAQEPIVCCKDCIYWKSNMLTHFWKPCDVVSTDKDWYCPCGKRR